MAKIHVLNTPTVLDTTAAQTAKGYTSGSLVCDGFSRLVGLLYSNASAAVGSASGLVIRQSADGGANWDVVSASYQVTASAASVFNVNLLGNAVKVEFWNGATAASLFRCSFRLMPI